MKREPTTTLEVGDIFSICLDFSTAWEVLCNDGAYLIWQNVGTKTKGVDPIDQLQKMYFIRRKALNQENKYSIIISKIRYLDERFKSRSSKTPMPTVP
jgi:hypothetical protein